jgi:hypothetical protein
VIQKKENEKWRMTFYVSKKNITFSRIFYKENLFKRNHDDFHAKHFKYEKILELFRRKYWWLNMSKNVKKYVVSCTKCSLTKSIKHKIHELLQ